jgi:hypothetical protein
MPKTRPRWSHPGRLVKNLVNNPHAAVVRSDPQPPAGRERRKRVVDDNDNDDSEPAAKKSRGCVARARNRSRSHGVDQHAHNEDSCE